MRNISFGMSQDYEFVLCYANPGFVAYTAAPERRYFETDDLPGRPWRYHDLTKQTSVKERPNSDFAMVDPRNGDEYPPNPNRSWAITKGTFQGYYDANKIIFPGDYGFLRIRRPVMRYWKEDDVKRSKGPFGFITTSSVLPSEVGMTKDGTRELTSLFGEKVFSFPKPVSLIEHPVSIATMTKPDALIIDFFTGSGTTGEAVLSLNAKDSGRRKFVLNTSNEGGICERIAYPRMKAVIEGVRPDGTVFSGGYDARMRYHMIDVEADAGEGGS